MVRLTYFGKCWATYIGVAWKGRQFMHHKDTILEGYLEFAMRLFLIPNILNMGLDRN
jgi:hypothetical protein